MFVIFLICTFYSIHRFGAATSKIEQARARARERLGEERDRDLKEKERIRRHQCICAFYCIPLYPFQECKSISMAFYGVCECVHGNKMYIRTIILVGKVIWLEI